MIGLGDIFANSIFSPSINPTIGQWARKDRRSNYVLAQWIEERMMMGFVMVVIWKCDKNTCLFAGNPILLSLSVCLHDKKV